MLGLAGLAAVSGGVVGRLLNGRRGKEMKVLRAKEAELQEQVAVLERSLREARDKDPQHAKIEELQRSADAIRAAMEELRAKNDDLEQRNGSLANENQDLVAAKDRFASQAQQLSQEKEQMSTQMEAMRTTHAEQLSEYQQQLDQLRAQVSETMSKLLAHTISSKEAVAAMEEMGCKVAYIEAPPSTAGESAEERRRREAEWAQPQLLLNDLGRLERMVAAAHRLTGAEPTSSSTQRLPVVMFPSMGAQQQMSALRFKLPAALGGSSDTQATPRQAITQAPASTPQQQQQQQQQRDVAGRGKGDQTSKASTPAIDKAGSGKAHKKGADQADAGAPKPGVKFTYSLQGTKGNQWIAKVPLTGMEQPTGPVAYLSSDNSPKLVGCAPPLMAAAPAMGGGAFMRDDDLMDAPCHALGLRL